jgi:hypothetical protein
MVWQNLDRMLHKLLLETELEFPRPSPAAL